MEGNEFNIVWQLSHDTVYNNTNYETYIRLCVLKQILQFIFMVNS